MRWNDEDGDRPTKRPDGSIHTQGQSGRRRRQAGSVISGKEHRVDCALLLNGKSKLYGMMSGGVTQS